MPTLQLTSLIQYFNFTNHTWTRQKQSSQIDDIWLTANILQDVSSIDSTSSTGSTDSDHVILHFKWMLPQTFTTRNKKKIARKIFLYHKMTKE
ncbi:15788_t:CDS:1, partial [Gigaspora rosea]